MKNNFWIGYCGKTRGLKGFIYFNSLDWIRNLQFRKGDKLYFFFNQKVTELILENATLVKERWILKFNQLNSQNEVKHLVNQNFFVSERQYVKMTHTWYWPHFMHYSIEHDNCNLGRLIDFYCTPAHLIGKIKCQKPSGYFLLPLIDEYIENIDQTKKMIKVKANVIELKKVLFLSK